MARKMSKKRRKELQVMAEALVRAVLPQSSIEDAVSICATVSRGVKGVSAQELTIEEGSLVCDLMGEIDEKEELLTESIRASVVIDCTNALEGEISQIATFSADEAGKEAAEGLFRAWVKESMDQANPYTEEQINEFISDGKCEIGEGYILLCKS